MKGDERFVELHWDVLPGVEVRSLPDLPSVLRLRAVPPQAEQGHQHLQVHAELPPDSQWWDLVYLAGWCVGAATAYQWPG